MKLALLFWLFTLLSLVAAVLVFFIGPKGSITSGAALDDTTPLGFDFAHLLTSFNGVTWTATALQACSLPTPLVVPSTVNGHYSVTPATTPTLGQTVKHTNDVALRFEGATTVLALRDVTLSYADPNDYYPQATTTPLDEADPDLLFTGIVQNLPCRVSSLRPVPFAHYVNPSATYKVTTNVGYWLDSSGHHRHAVTTDNTLLYTTTATQRPSVSAQNSLVFTATQSLLCPFSLGPRFTIVMTATRTSTSGRVLTAVNEADNDIAFNWLGTADGTFRVITSWCNNVWTKPAAVTTPVTTFSYRQSPFNPISYNGTTFGSGSPVTNAYIFRPGINVYAGETSDCTISEIQMYNRLLTDAELVAPALPIHIVLGTHTTDLNFANLVPGELFVTPFNEDRVAFIYRTTTHDIVRETFDLTLSDRSIKTSPIPLNASLRRVVYLSPDRFIVELSTHDLFSWNSNDNTWTNLASLQNRIGLTAPSMLARDTLALSTFPPIFTPDFGNTAQYRHTRVYPAEDPGTFYSFCEVNASATTMLQVTRIKANNTLDLDFTARFQPVDTATKWNNRYLLWAHITTLINLRGQTTFAYHHPTEPYMLCGYDVPNAWALYFPFQRGLQRYVWPLHNAPHLLSSTSITLTYPLSSFVQRQTVPLDHIILRGGLDGTPPSMVLVGHKYFWLFSATGLVTEHSITFLTAPARQLITHQNQTLALFDRSITTAQNQPRPEVSPPYLWLKNPPTTFLNQIWNDSSGWYHTFACKNTNDIVYRISGDTPVLQDGALRLFANSVYRISYGHTLPVRFTLLLKAAYNVTGTRGTILVNENSTSIFGWNQASQPSALHNGKPVGQTRTYDTESHVFVMRNDPSRTYTWWDGVADPSFFPPSSDSRGGDTLYFKGSDCLVYELIIFDRWLSDENIQVLSQDMASVPSPSPVAPLFLVPYQQRRPWGWYRPNTLSGNTWPDASGHNRPAVTTNAPTLISGAIHLNQNQSLLWPPGSLPTQYTLYFRVRMTNAETLGSGWNYSTSHRHRILSTVNENVCLGFWKSIYPAVYDGGDSNLDYRYVSNGEDPTAAHLANVDFQRFVVRNNHSNVDSTGKIIKTCWLNGVDVSNPSRLTEKPIRSRPGQLCVNANRWWPEYSDCEVYEVLIFDHWLDDASILALFGASESVNYALPIDSEPTALSLKAARAWTDKPIAEAPFTLPPVIDLTGGPQTFPLQHFSNISTDQTAFTLAVTAPEGSDSVVHVTLTSVETQGQAINLTTTFTVSYLQFPTGTHTCTLRVWVTPTLTSEPASTETPTPPAAAPLIAVTTAAPKQKKTAFLDSKRHVIALGLGAVSIACLATALGLTFRKQ